MKRIVHLSTKEISKLIDDLNKYKRELYPKCEKLIKRLYDIGYYVVSATMSEVDLGQDYWSYSVDDIHASSGIIASMTMRIEGDKILFIEFGAGVIHSNPQHPMASDFGYGVGTYPDQVHAFDLNGWWYTDERTGEKVHSEGNEAYMPGYKAAVEMANSVYFIAKEIFKTT